ncbi:MAG: hypothetical protein N3E44_08025, partial [Candidatus Bathyarchaeota archaeon]|nr:hypothetical protein [Candidatus Bathyarchaeota archaeon]
MPFTPLHIGPPLILGYILRRRMHLPTLIVASLAVDMEPITVIILGIPGYPMHGYLHTLPISIPLGFILGVVMYIVDRVFEEPFRHLSLSEHSGYGVEGYISAGVSGWILHILLDSPLYDDIKPLYPLEVNPFYNPHIASIIPHICLLLLFVGSLLYLREIHRILSIEVGGEAAWMCTGLIAIL